MKTFKTIAQAEKELTRMQSLDNGIEYVVKIDVWAKSGKYSIAAKPVHLIGNDGEFGDMKVADFVKKTKVSQL